MAAGDDGEGVVLAQSLQLGCAQPTHHKRRLHDVRAQRHECTDRQSLKLATMFAIAARVARVDGPSRWFGLRRGSMRARCVCVESRWLELRCIEEIEVAEIEDVNLRSYTS